VREITFLFGVHCHQPVGNFEYVLRDACRQAYRPFLECLERHPAVRTSLHYSGCLLEWFAANAPDLLDLIRSLVERGQVELISGGFYEPILPVIPRQDAIEQMVLLNRFLTDEFGVTPRGLWLPERVWEPTIPTLARAAGLEYTIVDDTHFLYAGLAPGEIHGHYTTEDEGAVLVVFPIDRQLRYLIPFRVPEETIRYLEGLAGREDVATITMADDGEKFGVWPGTADWVYGKGWLEKFFTLLEESADWLTMITFSESIDRETPRSQLYLPTASYEEMMGWALPAPAQGRYEQLLEELTAEGRDQADRTFIRGGFWRNFLSKYAESNTMHKKMLLVSRKVRELEEVCGRPRSEHQKPSAGRGSGRPREELCRALFEAKRHLLRGQCNCAYWHGVFGGLYLNHLRSAIFTELIRSEHLADRALRGKGPWVEVREVDFDADGQEELLVETGLLNLYLDPADGGTIFEFDYRPARFNLYDTLTRRPEAYHARVRGGGGSPEGGEAGDGGEEGESGEGRRSIHEEIALKEQGLAERLIYDRWRRTSLRNMFLPASTTFEEYAAGEFAEIGDFAGGAYHAAVDREEEGIRVILRRSANAAVGGDAAALSVEKVITVHPSRAALAVDFSVGQRGVASAMRFGVEFNLTLLAGDAGDRYYLFPAHDVTDRTLAGSGSLEEVGQFSVVDEYQGFCLSFGIDPPASVWRFPIETVSLSETGIERTYQGSALFLSWVVANGGGEIWRARLTQGIAPWPS